MKFKITYLDGSGIEFTEIIKAKDEKTAQRLFHYLVGYYTIKKIEVENYIHYFY